MNCREEGKGCSSENPCPKSSAIFRSYAEISDIFNPTPRNIVHRGLAEMRSRSNKSRKLRVILHKSREKNPDK